MCRMRCTRRIAVFFNKISNINVGRYLYVKFPHSGIAILISKMISVIELKRLIKGSELITIKMDSINHFNQGTHPDILISKNVLNRKYVLTVSGYPFHLAKYENQYVLMSNDGVYFKNTMGKNKAVATYNGNGNSHYSDGEIIEDGDKFILYYRMCYEDCEEPYITIFSRESNDLINWTNEREIVSEKGIAFISPAFLKNNNDYYMYYVDHRSEDYRLRRRCAKDPEFVEFKDEDILICNEPSEKNIWHIDVAETEKGLYGLFVFSVGEGGRKARLYEAVSNDNGQRWTIGNEIKLDINYKIVDRIYRSSFVYKGNNVWDLYLAVKTTYDCWYILLKKGYVFSFDDVKKIQL